jgi:hypothetical protein
MFRATSPASINEPLETINSVIRNWAGNQVVMAREKLKWVDLADLNMKGNEIFLDHVHFNSQGDDTVARLLMDQLGKQLPADVVGKRSRSADLTTTECLESLGYNAWQELKILNQMLDRFQRAPFNQQIDHEARVGALKGKIRTLEQQLNPEAWNRFITQYRTNSTHDPAGWIQLRMLAELLLKGLKEPEEAGLVIQELMKRIPGHPGIHADLGLAEMQLGRLETAGMFLECALWLPGTSLGCLAPLPAAAMPRRTPLNVCG